MLFPNLSSDLWVTVLFIYLSNGTVVKRTLPSLHEGLIEIMFTIPLMFSKIKGAKQKNLKHEAKL